MIKRKNIIIGIIALHLLLFLVYALVLRGYIIDAYHNQAPSWFEGLIKALYPRFYTEQHRFTEDFFVQKADQIIIRYLIVLALIGIFYRIFQQKKSKNLLPDLSTKTYHILLVVWVILSIWIAHDWIGILYKMTFSSDLYQPIGLYRVLPFFPTKNMIYVLWGTWFVSTLLSLSRYGVIFSSLSVFLFLFLQGFLWGFHKLDHTWASFNYVSLWIPLMISEYQKARDRQVFLSWSVFGMQLSVAWIYFQAGIEKLLVGGIEWFYPQTFRSYLLVSHTDLGLWVSQFDFVCVLLPTLAVLFELLFIIFILNNRFLPLLMVIGIVFHINTYLLFEAGGLINTWTLTYFVFIPSLPLPKSINNP